MCRHENEKKSAKKRKSEIQRKIDDDAILYSFQSFFIKKIFYLILKKLHDHLKRHRNKENDILRIQMIRKSKKEKNQKITKTKREKFVKKSNHHQSSFTFENESRFHFFRHTKKKRWTSSFNKSVTNEAWQFRKNIFELKKDLLSSFLFINWTVWDVLFHANRIRSSSRRNNSFTSQNDDEIREIEKRCRRNNRVCRFDNKRSKECSNFDEYSLS